MIRGIIEFVQPFQLSLLQSENPLSSSATCACEEMYIFFYVLNMFLTIRSYGLVLVSTFQFLYNDDNMLIIFQILPTLHVTCVLLVEICFSIIHLGSELHC